MSRLSDRFRVRRTDLLADLRAGLVHGLVSVPDGLASGLLAGLNPVAGLYGYLFGTLAGAFATSSALMSVQGTGAMAVIIADTPGLRGADAPHALATLTLLTGTIMLGAGLARLGGLVRFVPNAVLTGFVNAVAVNIMLAQLAGVTGFSGRGENRLTRAADTLLNVGSFRWPTVAAALLTFVLILLLERTRLGALGLFLAIVVVSGVVAAFPALGVPTLASVAELPHGLPPPTLPSIALVPDLVVPAAALAFVGLVQGTAISQSIPNPDGRYPDASGDFRGQGIANLLSGLFRGVPVGGSMSGTALVVAAGGRTRYANIVAALVMMLSVLFLSSAVRLVAMPSLAALLMLIGWRTLKPDAVRMAWRTGRTQAAVMATTFVVTLLVPVQYAVLAGVGFAVILYVARQSNRVSIRRWTLAPSATYPTETDPPRELPAGEIVVLTAYGSLFFASAAAFGAQLPAVGRASEGAVVVLRLRGKEELGSTFIKAITLYREALVAARCHFVVTGVGERVLTQLTNTGALAQLGPDNVFKATPNVGESLQQGIERARALQAQAPDQR